MKKILTVLLGILLFANVNFVYAETNGEETITTDGDTDATAVVGDVETPVYEVNINWQRFVFDWAYDYETQKYTWKRHLECKEITYDELLGYGYDLESSDYTYYIDSDCKESIDFTDELVVGSLENDSKLYYYESFESFFDNFANLNITDVSTGGSADIKIGWESESDYEYTNADLFWWQDEPSCYEVSEDEINEEREYYITNDCTGNMFVPSEKPQVEHFYDITYEPVEHKLDYDKVNNTYDLSNAKNINLGGDGSDHISHYDLLVKLSVDNTKEVTHKPVSGETIGTLTVTITTH